MTKPLRTNKTNSKVSPDEDNPINIQEPVVAIKRESFSGWPMIIGWAAMLVFTFQACTHMVAAGDTWVAMACGRHFANHGVDTVEPFSANSHKAGPTEAEIQNWPSWAQWITNKVGLETVKKWHPTGWIDQNWLTHLMFYKLVPKSSYADGVSFTSNALVYWKFSIYIFAVICLYYTSRLLGANRLLAVVFSCFALFTGRSFLDIRPAGFSNLLVAVFLLILALTTYRNALYIWLIVPLTVLWSNIHGGYIYVFIMMIPFIGLHLFTRLNRKWTAIIYNISAWPFLFFVLHIAGLTLASFLFTILVIALDILLIFFKDKLVCLEWKGIYHTIGAFFAAFFASILFNPFHLTNLTHTFIISVSKNAARWRDIHEWHPAFDWSNPVGTAVPFLIMYIILWAVFIGWLIAMIKMSNSDSEYPRRKKKSSDNFAWPRVNASMIIIAALTIYMAVRSRRFIPIAAIAGCPIIAMLLTQLIHAVSAKLNFLKGHSYAIPQLPKDIQNGLVAAGALTVIFFGTWWGLKFKHVYLDPWPNDPKFSSVFMRMTASDAKPFYAMKFIKDNKLKGKMFNYWTEGGFIAWGQQPDPNTGFTPLQLFMDGRAQAAYNRTMFDEWSIILAGGRTTFAILQRAQAKNEDLTTEDYQQIGEYMDQQFKNNQVWVVMMPASVYTDWHQDPWKPSSYYAIKSLDYNPSWRLVFLNDKQKIFVDITTPQGKKLYDGILTGETKFPDAYHSDLMRADILLEYEPTVKDKQDGLDYAIKAFNASPTPIAMMEMVAKAARYINLLPQVRDFCKKYSDSFDENHEAWKKMDGYRLKVDAARLANYHLAYYEGAQGNKELQDTYTARRNFCLSELGRINESNRW